MEIFALLLVLCTRSAPQTLITASGPPDSSSKIYLTNLKAKNNRTELREIRTSHIMEAKYIHTEKERNNAGLYWALLVVWADRHAAWINNEGITWQTKVVLIWKLKQHQSRVSRLFNCLCKLNYMIIPNPTFHHSLACLLQERFVGINANFTPFLYWFWLKIKQQGVQ